MSAPQARQLQLAVDKLVKVGLAAAEPRAAEPVHVLGLLKIRPGDRAQATLRLRKAAGLAPRNAGFSFVYALALTESSTAEQALAVINNALRHSPLDASLLQARIELERQSGKNDSAAQHETEYRRHPGKGGTGPTSCA